MLACGNLGDIYSFMHRLKSDNLFIYTNNDYIHYTLSILNSKVIFFK
jgi:hypothetical protein